MQEGKVILHRFTIVEGWTLAQLLDALSKDTRFQHTLNTHSPNALWHSLASAPSPLEGLFFAASYDYPRGTPNTQILKQAFDLMAQKLATAWATRTPHLPWKTAYEALIAASLVEKETALPHERPQVAGVIARRLAKQMPLQIDASVIYGRNTRANRALTLKALQTDTPYNTYTRRGLPPTPIAIPSLSAINAVLHPDTTQTLYFVAKGDGSHVFSTQLDAHCVAVKHYRRHQNNLPLMATAAAPDPTDRSNPT